MRISSKGRYGLASMIYMAGNYYKDEYITVISISESLNISKIYLEQVFLLLKKSNIITSIKGSKGGYKLANSPDKISAYDILFGIEQGIFEKTETSIGKCAEHIEMVMQSAVFSEMDKAIYETLKNITLIDLVGKAENFKNSSDYMFFI